eukprot:694313-Prorocentrum_minimum.AAC.1
MLLRVEEKKSGLLADTITKSNRSRHVSCPAERRRREPVTVRQLPRCASCHQSGGCASAGRSEFISRN